MAKKVLSIVIGTECTKVCEVSYKKNYKNKGIRVYRSISFPTPPNTIEDGYIKDKDVFGEELRIRLKAAKIKTDKVIFSVASSKIANREVMIPPVAEKKIMDIITTGASDYFPIDLKEYILSYLILEKKTSLNKERRLRKRLEKQELKLTKQQEKHNKRALKKKSKTEIIADNLEQMDLRNSQQEQSDNSSTEQKAEDKGLGKKHMRLSVFAVPATLVKNYYNFASSMHFDIVSIDYSGNSSYQMIKRQANRGTNVFVQLNEQDTMISILQENVLILQRTVGYGISSLLDSVIEQPLLKASNQEEALQLLFSKNLLSLEKNPQDSIKFDDSWTKGEAAAASEYVRAFHANNEVEEDKELEARRNIRDSLHFLTSSIARMLDYYKSNHKEARFDMVYISGTGSAIKGIDDFFYTEIGIPHKRMEKLWTVSSNKKATAYRNNPSEFISCIGAVIKPIDFVPIEFIIKKQKRSTIIATVIFALACLAGSAGTIYVSYTDYQLALEEVHDAEKQLQAMEPLSGVHDELEQAQAELEVVQNWDIMTQSKNELITDIIEELEKKLPSGTIIHSLQFSESGVNMQLSVYGDSLGLRIAKLVKQLETIEYFADVVPPSSYTPTTEDGISSVSLTITCTYQ